MERTTIQRVSKALLAASVVVMAAGCAMPVPPDAHKMYTQQQLNEMARQPNPAPLAPPPGTPPQSTEEAPAATP